LWVVARISWAMPVAIALSVRDSFNFDLSAYKNFKISERFKVQFRAEFFNVLNHPSFGPPLAFQGAKSAQIIGENGLPSGLGIWRTAVTKPREGQLALKVIW